MYACIYVCLHVCINVSIYAMSMYAYVHACMYTMQLVNRSNGKFRSMCEKSGDLANLIHLAQEAEEQRKNGGGGKMNGALSS